jgi:signal transduction histidine kinase/ligand-binding sensor domain-containing protein
LAASIVSTTCSAATNSPWFARSWDSEEGLPNNTVSGLAQTADGYLWLGTPNSLVRFDGLIFEEFSPTNFIAPPNRGTIVMLHGRDDALWLGLDRGAVVRLHGRESQAFTEGLPNIIPNGLAEDAEGTLWVAYRGGAVYRIKDGKISGCAALSGLPDGADLCALASDNNGRVWFGKAGQVGVIRNGAFETLHRFEPLPARLAAAHSGGMWLCLGYKLLKIEEDGQVQDLGEFRPERAGTFVTMMLEDREGAVWIGTSYSGLFRHYHAGFEAIPTTHQEILSLAEDREGNLWVGTAGGGLSRIRRRAITLEGVDAGLPFAAVQSICEDSTGTLWAATQTGALARRSRDQWTALSATNGWPEDATCVAADAHGSLWIGTRLHGLWRRRDGQFTRWSHGQGEIIGQTIHTLLVSKTGDLWIGEENPSVIQRMRGSELQAFEMPADSRIVRAMVEDAAGNVWAGTSKGVLVRVSGETISEIKPRPMGELASIRCLGATADGSLWIGYAGWGIGRLKNGHYAEIDTDEGLHDNYIAHIVPDNRGWLWFGANRGIFKVRLQELEDAADGRIRRVRSIHYGRSEGLPSLQGTFGDSPDAVRSRDGRLWIPMRTALVVVDPDKLGEYLEPPPIVLSRVSVEDRLIASYRGVLPAGTNRNFQILTFGGAEAGLRLPPVHRPLEFEFAAPSLAAPENVQFRYRLEGFEDDWFEAGSKRTARYPRLPAGTYVFRVTACNRDGIWSNTGAVMSLVVTPFFWQTWWFRSVALVLFTFAIIAIVRYVSFRRLHQRLRLLEQQAAVHKERARIAKDIHDDLGANLTQIALLGELAQQDRAEPEKAAERSNKISATARQAIKSLDEIVWAVNPRNDTLAHLIDYAGQFALDYLRLAGIRCRLDFPERTPVREVSTEVRHNLFLVVKEALNNIVKHAHATEVWLRADATDDRLRLVIEDNGRGFDRPPEDAWADGLRNMRQRLAEIGGECRIESKTGAGTKILVELPWPRK